MGRLLLWRFDLEGVLLGCVTASSTCPPHATDPLAPRSGCNLSLSVDPVSNGIRRVLKTARGLGDDFI